MATVAACEQFMRVAIGEYEAQTSQNPILVDTEKRRIFSKKVSKWDFGSLTQQMCDRYPNSTELRDLLKKAKDTRNYLAHEFWAGHFGNLHSKRGIAIIVGECELHELHFHRLSDFFIEKFNIKSTDYNNFVADRANDELLMSNWEELLAAARNYEIERFEKK